MTIELGATAPAFKLLNERGEERSLSEFRGRPVVLYFYPEDDTPACTTQACGYRDAFSDFRALDAVVIGISGDSPESHEAFRKKFDLPFVLLSDPDHKVATNYGAYGEKLLYGRKVVGTIRSSIVIDARGRIAGVHRNVRSAPNAARMLDAVRKLVKP